MKLFVLPVLALGLFAGRAFAQVGAAGAEFLTIEQGARGLGMGGAFTAVADDVGALWWNPAGLGRSSFSEATFSQTAYIQNVATEYVGFVKPFAPLGGTLGASFTYLSIPGLDGTDATGQSTGKLSAGGYVGALSYGTNLSEPGMTVGGTAKYISQTLGSNSGTGIAADVGVQYRDAAWGLGLVVQNIGPAFTIGSTSDPLPREIRGGGFYKVLQRRVTLSLDEEKPYNDTLRAHLGAEWLATQGLRLRAGFEQAPNAGAGAGLTLGFGLAGVFGGAPVKKEDSGEADVFRPFWEQLGAATGQDPKAAIARGAYLVSLDYAFVADGAVADIHRFTLNVKF